MREREDKMKRGRRRREDGETEEDRREGGR